MGCGLLRRTGLVGGVAAALTMVAATPVLGLQLVPGDPDAAPPAEAGPETGTAGDTPGSAGDTPSSAADDAPASPGDTVAGAGDALGDSLQDTTRSLGDLVGSSLEGTTRGADDALDRTLEGPAGNRRRGPSSGDATSPSQPTPAGDDAATPGVTGDDAQGDAGGDAADPGDASGAVTSAPATTDLRDLVESTTEALADTAGDTTRTTGEALGGTVEDTTATTGQAANDLITGATAAVGQLADGALNTAPGSEPPGLGPSRPGLVADPSDGGSDGGAPGDAGATGDDPGDPPQLVGAPGSLADPGTATEAGNTEPPALARLTPWDPDSGALTPTAVPGWLVTTATILVAAVGAGHLANAAVRLRGSRTAPTTSVRTR